VLNIAIGKDVNADRQGQFLSLVDRFTARTSGCYGFFMIRRAFRAQAHTWINRSYRDIAG
jgi:hypothetical protein